MALTSISTASFEGKVIYRISNTRSTLEIQILIWFFKSLFIYIVSSKTRSFNFIFYNELGESFISSTCSALYCPAKSYQPTLTWLKKVANIVISPHSFLVQNLKFFKKCSHIFSFCGTSRPGIEVFDMANERFILALVIKCLHQRPKTSQFARICSWKFID